MTPDPAHAGAPKEETQAVARLLESLGDPFADVVELTRALRPRQADYAAYFVDDVADRVAAAYDDLWADPSLAIEPNEGQTEYWAVSATVDEIREWTEIPSEWFPGGYREAAPFLKPGNRVWVFKFTEPGRTLGMSYDGLVFLGGRPVFFPKPWRALR